MCGRTGTSAGTGRRSSGNGPAAWLLSYGAWVAADPRFLPPPLFATYPIGRQANAFAGMNLRPLTALREHSVGASMLIMAWRAAASIDQLRSMDDL